MNWRQRSDVLRTDRLGRISWQQLHRLRHSPKEEEVKVVCTCWMPIRCWLGSKLNNSLRVSSCLPLAQCKCIHPSHHTDVISNITSSSTVTGQVSDNTAILTEKENKKVKPNCTLKAFETVNFQQRFVCGTILEKPALTHKHIQILIDIDLWDSLENITFEFHMFY